MKHVITCTTLLGLILCGLFGFSEASFGKWQEKDLMLTPRWGLATTAVNEKIYALGGQDNTPQVHAMEEYDTKTGNWSEKNNMPTGRLWLGAATIKGKVYAIGGTKDNFTALGVVEEYNPRTDTWTRKTAMPTPRLGFGIAVIGNRIWTVGGAGDLFIPSPAVEVYSPETDTWEKKPDMPNPRWGIGAAAVLSKIYIFGGALDNLRKKATDSINEYDTRTNTWTPKTKLSKELYGVSATFVNSGKIYVIGGQAWQGRGGVVVEDWAFYPTVAEYDPETDKLTKVNDNMPTARSASGDSVVGGKVYVIGGWPGGAGGGRNHTEVFTPPGWPFPATFSVSPQDKLATTWGEIKHRQ